MAYNIKALRLYSIITLNVIFGWLIDVPFGRKGALFERHLLALTNKALSNLV